MPANCAAWRWTGGIGASCRSQREVVRIICSWHILRYRAGAAGTAVTDTYGTFDWVEKLLNPDPQQLKIWLDAVARKDAHAFRRLYDAVSPKLFGFALRILIKREAAEEVLQESFVNIWNNAGSYQASLAAPMTWMTTIVRNKAFDVLRRTDHTVELDGEAFGDDGMLELIDTLESAAPTPGQALQHSQDAKALAQCMARLEGLHRQAIALAFFHDLSHSEVAQQMNLPMGTVKTWIRRGLERLRLCLVKLESA